MIRFNKNTLAVTAVVVGGLFLAVPAAFAQTASSSNILQDVQAAVQSLVSAKDTGNTNDVALRVTAFEQVLTLSESEAQSYELKLVNTQSSKAYDVWKNNALDALGQALAYYNQEDQLLNGTSTITSADIKQIATDFAKWRAETYLPLVGAIQDFLLVNQEAGAVQTAQTRYGKIVNDLQGLGLPTVTGSQEIAADLKDASSSISAAADFSRQAAKLFLSLYVNATSTATSTASASSTATSSLPVSVAPLNLTATSSANNTATSTAAPSTEGGAATSTALAGQATSTVVTSSNPISIKGLVTASLDKVRNAYQDFIDISNLVRSLLD